MVSLGLIARNYTLGNTAHRINDAEVTIFESTSGKHLVEQIPSRTDKGTTNLILGLAWGFSNEADASRNDTSELHDTIAMFGERAELAVLPVAIEGFPPMREAGGNNLEAFIERLAGIVSR
jgi:hypothetical protein